MRLHSEPLPGSGDRATRDSIVRDPNRQADLRSFFDLSSKWETDADLRYVSAINNQNVPGYTELDLRVWVGIHPPPGSSRSAATTCCTRTTPEFNPPGNRRAIERSLFGKATWRF